MSPEELRAWYEDYLDAYNRHDLERVGELLAGDVEGRAGKMTAGSYFWRPEYITHGPYWSESGLLTFVRGHGDIVAHWIEDPDSTVEDNRAYLAALQG